jgi:glyoxylase-like metal-dependent hydrolase (beta-lactamase superfamily II)
MRLIKSCNFGDVKAYELGWSPFGHPMLTVYLFVVDDLMVDTGLRHMCREVLEIAGDSGIREAVLTHHHEDHSGNAAALKDTLNVTVYGHPLSVSKMKSPYNILFYQHYVWGKTVPLQMAAVPEVVETTNFKLKPIHTPGHSRDHVVYLEPERGILFSGDLYLSDRIKYFRADEVISDQIESLKKVLHLDFDTLLCSHYPKPAKGKERIAKKLQFLEQLHGDIRKFWEKGYGEKQIFREMGLKEQHFIKWFCFGNVSMQNVVHSAIRSFEARP